MRSENENEIHYNLIDGTSHSNIQLFLDNPAIGDWKFERCLHSR
jgi:hypothetical protein